MNSLTIALNIVFSALVLTTIVGGLLLAVLNSRGKHRPTAARRLSGRPDGPASHNQSVTISPAA